MMKRKIVVGSLFAVFLMILLPISTAVQSNVTDLRDLKTIRDVTIDDLLDLMIEMAAENPEIPEEMVKLMEELKENEVLYEEFEETPDDNQSILERVWFRILNYRVFRLYLSLCLFAYFRSKLTLMRTMTWGIKLLRWVKIGVILGFVDPTLEEPPETPQITFVQDYVNFTITVTSVDRDDVQWTDIDNVGSGNCDPFPDGVVEAGDQIINCSGIIVLRYIPTNVVLGIFEF